MQATTDIPFIPRPYIHHHHLPLSRRSTPPGQVLSRPVRPNPSHPSSTTGQRFSIIKLIHADRPSPSLILQSSIVFFLVSLYAAEISTGSATIFDSGMDGNYEGSRKGSECDGSSAKIIDCSRFEFRVSIGTRTVCLYCSLEGVTGGSEKVAIHLDG